MCDVNSTSPKLALASSSTSAYSQTFIRQHIDKLPFNVQPIYREGVGWVAGNGCGINPSSNVAYRMVRKLLRPRHVSAFDENLAQWLVGNHIKALLAEFGPIGVAAMGGCALAQTPLIVHFHGYDASRKVILEQYRSSYRRMFEQAHAVIVVSRPMSASLEVMGMPGLSLIHI